jgi:sodium/potassium-transporting ATPase subunit beta
MAADDVDFAGKGQKKSLGARVRSCCNGVWNRQKKEFLGRTGSSWAKISLFYIVFYSCLAGFFAIMLVGFFSTLDPQKPTMQDMYSLIKQNPGMGFRPMEKDRESTLISFNSEYPANYSGKILDIITYLKENKYIVETVDENEKYVKNPISQDSDGKDLFEFDFQTECTINNTNVNNSFGYSEGNPCVLLKINRVINWIPEPVDLSSDMGKEMNNSFGGQVGSAYSNNSIVVSCEGENEADVDNLGKPVFIPAEGFSFDYYPYINAEHYRPPLVFARFPNAKSGVVIQIWCKLWVQNIKHHKNDKGGSVHLELMIDRPPPPKATHH